MDFAKIVFRNEDHSYRYDGQLLVPATSVVQSIVPPFDTDKVSRRVALKEGRSQEEIIKDWHHRGKKSRDKGDRLHCYIEDVVAGNRDQVLYSINDRILEMDAFDRVWGLMQQGLQAEIFEKEMIVGDVDFGIAGRIDALMKISLAPGKSIFDWKSGKYRVRGTWGKLLAPFDDLDNCEHSKYSIQTNLYRLIYEKNTGEDLGDSYMLHLREDGTHQVHRAIDLRTRIKDWLADGLPSVICGDPTCERQAKDIIKALTVCGPDSVHQLSIRTAYDLGTACKKLTDDVSRYVSDESDESDDV